MYMDCFVSLKLKIPIRPLRMDVIKAFNNTIHTNNEGIKHDNYQRYLLKRKATNICKSIVL
jgi:hypothetical protein